MRAHGSNKLRSSRLARAFGARAAFAATLVALAAVGACRSPDGEVCRCASDCQQGLLCALESRVLGDGECATNGEIGVCSPDESAVGSETTVGDPPMFLDLWSKRDLANEPVTTGDGDGDTAGDGDGDTGDGDGDTGDGDGDTGDGDGDTGDGDGDTGDGDGDQPTTGDGDGDPTTTGDGDGDQPTTGDGDGDPTTGDGDGDPTTTGDGDGDPTTTGDGDGDTGP